MQLGELVSFLAVVRAGTFSGAAKATGIPKSTISKHVQNLESALQLRLFERTTRTTRLTEDGQLLREHATRLVSDASELERVMLDRNSEPRGPLRVAVPIMLGMEFIGPVAANLTKRWPQLVLDVAFLDRRVDLLEESFDCAIRSGPLPDSSLIARKLTTFRHVLVAAPELASQAQELQLPEHCLAFPTISFASHGNIVPWMLEGPGGRAEVNPKSAIVLGSLRAAASAAEAGGGIAFVPDIVARAAIASGSLVRILPQWAGEITTIQLVYPAHRLPSVKLREVVKELVAWFEPRRAPEV